MSIASQPLPIVFAALSFALAAAVNASIAPWFVATARALSTAYNGASIVGRDLLASLRRPIEKIGFACATLALHHGVPTGLANGAKLNNDHFVNGGP
jgi:hypothetical protein